jgi:hemoglobin
LYRTAIACLTTAVLAAAVAAAEPRPVSLADRAALDRSISDLLYDVINRGAELYNGGNHTACYHLYYGSLMTLKPLLDHRPELQKTIAKGLVEADRYPRPTEGAFVLREVLGNVRATVRQRPMPTEPLGPPIAAAPEAPAKPADPPKKPSPPSGATLWERMGGEENVKRIAKDFVTAAVADKEVNWERDGKYKMDEKKIADLQDKMVKLASLIGGGPLKYDGKLMKEAHPPEMKITDREFDAAVGHLKKALEKNGVRPEDVAFVLAAIETKRGDFVHLKLLPGQPTTLWERLGGEKNVRSIVEDFVTATLADKKNVNWDRDGKYKMDEKKVASLKESMVKLASTVSGGPLKYDGKLMKEIHPPEMKITDKEFDAVIEHLKGALDKHKVKPADRDDLLEIVKLTRINIVTK